jgi:hypothetical protein
LIGITIGGCYANGRKRFEGGQQALNGFKYKLFGCAGTSGTISPNGPFPLETRPCWMLWSILRNMANAAGDHRANDADLRSSQIMSE